jgi:hypothetical protein
MSEPRDNDEDRPVDLSDEELRGPSDETAADVPKEVPEEVETEDVSPPEDAQEPV